MNHSISVIMAVYNGEKTISETLLSIFKQTYKPKEVLIADDGSTDKTLQILEKFARIHPEIKIHTQKNQGPAIARNNLLKIASEKYITIMDADDFFFPWHLENSFKFLEKNPEIGFCDSQGIYSHSKVLGIDLRKNLFPLSLRYPLGINPFSFTPFNTEERLLEFAFHMPFFTPGLFFRKDLLKKSKPQVLKGLEYKDAFSPSFREDSTCEDFRFAIELSLKSPFRKLTVPSFFYRISPNQRSRVDMEKLKKDSAKENLYALSLYNIKVNIEALEFLNRISLEEMEQLNPILQELESMKNQMTFFASKERIEDIFDVFLMKALLTPIQEGLLNFEKLEKLLKDLSFLKNKKSSIRLLFLRFYCEMKKNKKELIFQ